MKRITFILSIIAAIMLFCVPVSAAAKIDRKALEMVSEDLEAISALRSVAKDKYNSSKNICADFEVRTKIAKQQYQYAKKQYKAIKKKGTQKTNAKNRMDKYKAAYDEMQFNLKYAKIIRTVAKDNLNQMNAIYKDIYSVYKRVLKGGKVKAVTKLASQKSITTEIQLSNVIGKDRLSKKEKETVSAIVKKVG